MAMTVKEVIDVFTGSPGHSQVLVEVEDDNGETRVYEVEDAGGYRQEFGAYVVTAGERADLPDTEEE